MASLQPLAKKLEASWQGKIHFPSYWMLSLLLFCIKYLLKKSLKLICQQKAVCSFSLFPFSFQCLMLACMPLPPSKRHCSLLFMIENIYSLQVFGTVFDKNWDFLNRSNWFLMSHPIFACFGNATKESFWLEFSVHALIALTFFHVSRTKFRQHLFNGEMIFHMLQIFEAAAVLFCVCPYKLHFCFCFKCLVLLSVPLHPFCV